MISGHVAFSILCAHVCETVTCKCRHIDHPEWEGDTDRERERERDHYRYCTNIFLITLFTLLFINRKYGVSFFNPQLPEWSTRYIPLEAAVKDTCSLLLYVISDETRGISSMIEVRRSMNMYRSLNVLGISKSQAGYLRDMEGLH